MLEAEKSRAARPPRRIATTVAEAIDAIDSGTSHRGKWWCFEGTMVDCALFTAGCIVFVEGKRTEASASRAVSWYPFRNQMLRNLDCARALAASDGRPYSALLVIEEGETSDARLAAAHNVVDSDVVEKSLPHLSPAERREALDNYLGFTRWQTIVRSFHLDPALVAQ